MPEVRHNTEQSRFEMDTSAGLAVADYRLNGSTMTIYHSEVPLPLRGRGPGARLVLWALQMAREKGYKIVPSCWFVRDMMQSSDKFDDLWANRSV
jgi:uncharacterized protein